MDNTDASPNLNSFNRDEIAERLDNFREAIKLLKGQYMQTLPKAEDMETEEKQRRVIFEKDTISFYFDSLGRSITALLSEMTRAADICKPNTREIIYR